MRQRDVQSAPRLAALAFAGVLLASASPLQASEGWRTLTPPQPMPAPEATGLVAVNGASIFYALYGSGNTEAVLLLHGGLGAGEDFGGQIPALATRYKVVAIDSRGHGRSTDDEQPYDYRLMAGDVMGVMDHLGIAQAAVVGWSDGGNIGLDLAINNPGKLTKLFALGANYQVSGVRPSAFNDALIHAYVGHAAARNTRASRRPPTRSRHSPGRCSRCGNPSRRSPTNSWPESPLLS